MTERQAEVMIAHGQRKKVRFSCALWLITDILMHPTRELLQMLRRKRLEAARENSCCSLEGTPRCNTKVLRHRASLKRGKMFLVAWQLIATRRLYGTKSAGFLECVMCAGEIALRRLHF